MQIEREVELRGRRLDGFARRLETSHPRHVEGSGVKREHHLEQRRARKVALRCQRFHDPLEGEVLVSVRVECAFAYLAQQFMERGILGEIATQRERVDEEADHPLELGSAASGNWRPHHHVGLPAPAREERLESRQQRHEERCAVALAKGAERGGQLRIEAHGQRGSASTPDSRAWSVGG